MSEKMIIYAALTFIFTIIFRVSLELSKRNKNIESIVENILCVLLAMQYAMLISKI